MLGPYGRHCASTAVTARSAATKQPRGRRAQPPSADPGLLRLRLAMTGRVVDPFFPLPRTKRSAFSRFPGPRVEHGVGSAKRRSGAHSSACTVASRVARRWAPDLPSALHVRVSDKDASSLPILRPLAVEAELRSEEHTSELQSLMLISYD